MVIETEVNNLTMLHAQPVTANDDGNKAAAQQLNRACEACRISKVRCPVDPNSPNSQCQRCAKTGKTCVFAPPIKRRKRKRTDVRVAELERQIRQLRSLLENRAPSGEISDHDSVSEEPDEQQDELDDEELSPDSQIRERNATLPRQTTEINCLRVDIEHDCGPVDRLGSSDSDIIDRNVISQEMAEELFELYRSELLPRSTPVLIPVEWTASRLRAEKPALFLAVMAAASQSKGSALSSKLHDELVHFYARNIFIKGEKSLQYIQALLVTVAFYTPSDSQAKMPIYQYSNIAASMALELGLASKPRTHEQLPKRTFKSLQRISSTEELMENCRTILSLYILAAGSAIRFRRPNILQYNSWMEESLSLLQQSPLIQDKRRVALLRLQRVVDEANTAFGFDDASTSVTLSELNIQVILRGFQRQMQEWRKSIPKEIMTSNLMIEYHQYMITMWEFAMDGGRYDAPDFRNRHLTLPDLEDDSVQPESLVSRSALQINGTIRVVEDAQSLLDCFIQFSDRELQVAPNVVFVRAIYALGTLRLKVDYATSTSPTGIGSLLDSSSLKISHYLSTIIQKTTNAIGPQGCCIPRHWLKGLKAMEEWHDAHQRWRSQGRHLKATNNGAEDVSSFNEEKLQDTAAYGTVPERTAPAQTYIVPNFGTGNAFAPWVNMDLAVVDETAVSTAGDNGANAPLSYQAQVPPEPDMGGFLAAAQGGDLYFLNEMMDGFGGWGGYNGAIYGDVGFGVGVGGGL